jgi:adenine-specific DNA-methyltransferase
MPEVNMDTARSRIQTLADTFKKGVSRYLSVDYQEAEARKDFIDKFFIALGWDVNHDEQVNPYEQEVKVERGVVVSSGQRRADYSFSTAPNYRDVRFYVEAKKPFGDIATAENYFQTIRYGWNSGTPVAVLTDFEQFHVLDCRYKPDPDSALNRALAVYHYTDYLDPDKFAEIYWLFSHEAVSNGSIDKFAANLPKPRGKAIQRELFPGAYKPVDEAFLGELDEYRTELARAFKKGKQDLNSEILTEIVQRTIDRLVFMRFLEDKQIESKQLVSSFGESSSPWEGFISTSRRLNSVYNGIIFKKHDILDDSKAFRPDENAFANICENLAHINSPYDFNAIPLHILGSIYERFLGKIIIATDKRVRIEEKPEVRKAGGVYYTPEYIVRYIVVNTIGRLIEGQTPADITKMRFIDIACGSGSFLLGIYDLLLQYHGNYYNALSISEKEKYIALGDCFERDGKIYLSLHKKRQILLNNVFGVDIDAQAVEVAQLSLYLRLLQDETTVSAHEHQQEFHGTLLPALGRNIICGNSLIGRDIHDGALIITDEEKLLNPMNFADAFPEVLAEGGFSAVVGNPPYVRIQGFPQTQIRYLSSHYDSAIGNFDIYVNFVEKAYKLLRIGGMTGYIAPNKFFKTDYGRGLRGFLSKERAVYRVVDFGASQVFDATTYTCLLFLSKAPHESIEYAQSQANPQALSQATLKAMLIDSLGSEPWIFADTAVASLFTKITSKGLRLLDLPVEMSRGSSTGNDSVFMVDNRIDFEADALRTPLFATDFGRYHFSIREENYVIFPYRVTHDDATLISAHEFEECYPKAFSHLRASEVILKKRKQYRVWYGYSAPRNLQLHERAQIAVPLLAERGSFALIPSHIRKKICPMASGGFTITVESRSPVSAAYVLGLLNSKLLFWILRKMSNIFRGGWITCTKQYFGELPIAICENKSKRDELVHLVESIIEANINLEKSVSDKDKTFYQSKVDSLDLQIDRLAYELYGLTEEEIALVEGDK